MVKFKTNDGYLIEIEEEFAIKSILIKNILKFTKVIEPIIINVQFKIMEFIYHFMMTDKQNLKENYNPLEIYFSKENLLFFDGISSENILQICNAANYLEYNFLLELCCKIIANELSSNKKSELAELIRGTEKLDEKILKKFEKEYDWFNESM